MKQVLGLCLVLALMVTWTAALEEETYEEAVRTLKAFSELRKAAEDRKRELNLWEEERGLKEKFECLDSGRACNILPPKCCGDLQCYWPDGFSAIRDGVCVMCVKVNNTCQRDDQCCEGMHCEKDKTLQVDGSCQSPGIGFEGCIGEGQKCRKNSQCCEGTGNHLQCDKGKLPGMDGVCGVYRRTGPCYKNGQCVNQCRRKWYQVVGVCE